MNAVAAEPSFQPLPHRPMRPDDLAAVHALEVRAYEFPWTQGIFRDCLASDYPARVVERDGAIVGYFLLSIAAGEAHILNICIAPELQGQGHGRALLHVLLQIARARGVERIFLEVRPSNPHAIALYHDEGFNEIGRRPRYYPARKGREDALVMALELFNDA
nr:ribosomal protein S18-alanine N-acetyltransferase [Lysobacter antarcticus]